jgi:hypothetical protein
MPTSWTRVAFPSGVLYGSLRVEASMGDTWITDMSHFDYRDEEVDSIPKSALKLWQYFGEIVAATVRKQPSLPSTGIPCRRRPGRMSCTGVIESELIPPGNELRWWCPVCADNGQITNWEGTRWAPSGSPMLVSIPRSGALFDAEHGSGLRILSPEIVEGTIEWDEETDGELPKIVTPKRTYTWEELGKELMTYEGFRISIKMG